MTRQQFHSIGREPPSGLLLPTTLKLSFPPAIGRLLTNLGSQTTKYRHVHVQAVCTCVMFGVY